VRQATNVTLETLQNLRDDRSSERKGSASAIIRRNSALAEEGDELRKSIQTEQHSTARDLTVLTLLLLFR
jgi:hypothetical protein